MSHGRQTTIQANDLAIDEVGGVGGKKMHKIGHLKWLTETPRGNPRFHWITFAWITFLGKPVGSRAQHKCVVFEDWSKFWVWGLFGCFFALL